MKKTLSLILALLLCFSSLCATAQFNDIDPGTLSWSGEAIEYLSQNNIIEGYGDGSFRPVGRVTRAEFAKMLSLAFDLKQGDIAYDDIDGHWGSEYILSASSVMYTPSTSFTPDKMALRDDIAYAVASVLELEPKDETVLDKFYDKHLVKEAMKSKIIAAVENGIIIGYEDSSMRPLNTVSRAEAAVIIYRALKIRDAALDNPSISSDASPEIPSDATPDKDETTPPEDNNEKWDHLYTLYPGADLILVSSVNTVADGKTGENAYRIGYRLANSTQEYSSVVPYDTEVKGTKTDISQLAPGDVVILNTAFHGYIGHLYVAASFANNVPVFDVEEASYAKEKYTLVSGKVTSVTSSSRNAILTIDTGSSSKEVFVPNNLDTNLFSQWKKNNKWSLSDVSYIEPDVEDSYVLIRLTDGVASDVVSLNYRH